MFGKDDAWKQVYIQPGKQKLNGKEALWYGRSRVQSDDYTRMGRQKCLMQAMLEQLSPEQVVLNAGKIATSSAEMLSTDIPASELGAFGDLALKAKDQQIATLSVVPPEYSTVTPELRADPGRRGPAREEERASAEEVGAGQAEELRRDLDAHHRADDRAEQRAHRGLADGREQHRGPRRLLLRLAEREKARHSWSGGRRR